jgi:molybdenum cofactor synthesis domain-containing protein
VTVRLRAKILTVSDGVVAGTRQDRSGPALADRLRASGWQVADRWAVADGEQAVADALRELAWGWSGIIVTTGGTGFSPRDRTPEATRLVLEREAPGLAEAMRQADPDKGRLSRGTAGTLGRCIVLNTPGSPAGAVECLDAVLDCLPHALALLTEEPSEHPA